MRAAMATEPGDADVPNEDWFGIAPEAVVVLDGVTVRAGIESGCGHGTPWYVRRLGGMLMDGIIAGGLPLADALAGGISAVAAQHAGTCDLGTVGAPSAAVGIVRLTGGRADWLVLADISVVLGEPGGVRVISDKRVDDSVAGISVTGPAVGQRIGEARTAHRNRPGGYWVAAADPEAAAHAVTGSAPLGDLHRLAVMTDGASRLADMFGMPWPDVLAIDPGDLIAMVRKHEADDAGRVRYPRFKVSDDATAVAVSP